MALGGPAESGEFLDISLGSGHPLGRFQNRSSGGSEWRCVESSLSRELEMLALFKSDLTFACFKEVMKCSSSGSFYAALS
jgi:hypothetical protein